MSILVETASGPQGLEIVKIADGVADIDRLQAEARVLAQIAHPGVVEITSTTETTLHLRHHGLSLARMTELEIDHRIAIIRNLAETVDALHRQGIAHNRIDADHVVVDQRGRPRLCGFGAATDATDTTTADDVRCLAALATPALDDDSGLRWSNGFAGIRLAGRRRRAVSSWDMAIAAASHPEHDRRPTARQFGVALSTALPGMHLPEATSAHASGAPASVVASSGPDRAFASIPDDIDPIADIGWTTADLTFLAQVDTDDPWDRPSIRNEAREPDTTDPTHGADPEPAHDRTPPDPGRQPIAFPIVDIIGPADDDPDVLVDAATEPMPTHTATEDEGLLRRPDHARLAVLAAVVLLVSVLGGVTVTRLVRPFTSQPVAASAAASTEDADPIRSADGNSAPDAPDSPATFVDPDDATSDPSSAAWPTTCVVPATPGPDVDGDGCPESVVIDGRIVTVGTTSVELGQDGDLVAVADSDCDGVATAVVLRPSSGEVFAFDDWGLDRPITVPARTVVDGGIAISAETGSCPAIVVTGSDGTATTVTGPR